MHRHAALFTLALVAAAAPAFAQEPAVAPATDAGAAVPTGPVYATPEALAEAVKAAFEARDVEAWKANVVLDGVSEGDRLILEQTLRKIFAVKPTVRHVSVDTLPDGFDGVQVGGGRKYTLTVKPAGVIDLKFGAGKADTEIALPYGRVGDGFKLGTLRSEKLDWKGEDDRLFVITVSHTGDPAEVATLIRYNASGIALEKRVSGRTPRLVLAAQHIEAVTVERAGEKGETTLTLTYDKKGEPVTLYTSGKLASAGKILFERKLDTPAAAEGENGKPDKPKN